MDRKILVAGAIGGMAVPALRAGLKLTQQVNANIDITPGYAVGAVVLAIVGMITVWFLDETERKKAFIIGLSLPATISSLGGQIHSNEEKAPAAPSASIFSLLVGTAHAADVTTLVPQQTIASSTDLGRYFRLVGNADGRVTVQLFDKDGTKLRSFVPDGTELENLPDAAATAVLKTRSGAEQKIALSEVPGSVTRTTVALKQESKNGFWQALGIQASVKESLSATATVDSVRKVGQVLWLKSPTGKVRVDGTAGVVTQYPFAQKTADARSTDGVLVPGDKFTVLEPMDASGRLMKVKLTELAAPPPTQANRIP